MVRFDFNRLIPDLQVEVLKNCDVKELSALALSSKYYQNFIKHEVIWEQLCRSNFNLNVKKCETWYETYMDRKSREWAIDFLSIKGSYRIRRLQSIDPQTWNIGAARRVQSPQQPIIVTPNEFNQIPKDLCDNYIFHNGNYYFVPLNEQYYRVVRLKLSQGRSYPALFTR